ncbi:MAG TPA: alkaline phosphatase D family protein [Myxococcota bacterium]|nr:alkaline phosphatase D family protein [Myxococcota bacterium]
MSRRRPRIVLPDRRVDARFPFARGGVSRRDVLRGLGALGLGAGLFPGFGGGLAGCTLANPIFPEGVACGDPAPDGAVIWTRAFPPARERNTVLWVVAEDEALQQIVTGGVAGTDASRAHAVHVPVTGLAPDRWYHYGFFAGDVASPVGRLRTAPAPGSQPDRLRYAFASCQQRTASYYVAHRALANEDIDFLMHLGDYIYVSDSGDITLADYRARWAIFKSHPLLQQLHAKVPVVPVWDDGEFYNGVDATGDPARLAAARRAWFENMPVLQPADDHIYRRFPWGRLADVEMIDTRSYRDPEVPPNRIAFLAGLDFQDTTIPGCEAMFEEGRTTLGDAQRAWLLGEIGGSEAAWQIVGNSYNMTPWRLGDLDNDPDRSDPQPHRNAGIYVSNEAWDDYAAERRVVLSALEAMGRTDTLFSSGHTHFYLASELQPDYDDPASPTAAFDLVTGSLTADPDPREIASEQQLRFIEGVFLEQNQPYMKDIDMLEQGYAIVEVTPEEIVCDFRGIDTFDENAEPYTFARFRIVRGSRTLEELPLV